MRGKFITFEGGEGSGKSSVHKILKTLLPSNEYVFVNDPSNISGELKEIRRLLLSSEFDYCNNTELLLYGAARAELVFKFIKPVLNKGINVISDRFLDSTTVYQGRLKNHDKAKLDMLNAYFVGNLKPDMTILFDVDARTGLSRSFSRLEAENIDESRWEKKGLATHEKINAEYRKIAKQEPKRFRIVDSNNLIINEIVDTTLEFIYNINRG